MIRSYAEIYQLQVPAVHTVLIFKSKIGLKQR